MTSPARRPATRAGHVIAAGVAALALTGCAAVSAELAVPDGAGGDLCTPAGQHDAALFAYDVLENVGGTAARVVAVELVAAENLELSGFATVVEGEAGFAGVANGVPDPVDPDGRSGPIPPGVAATVQAQVTLLAPARPGTTRALAVSYADEAGSRTETVTTAFTITVVPQGAVCGS